MMYLVRIVIVLCLFSCNKKIIDKSTPRTKGYSHINEVYKEVDALKYFAFRSCLKSGYQNSSYIQELLKEEVVISDMPYSIRTLKTIDSLSQIVRRKIVTDSIYLKNKWLVENSDFENLSGKRVIAHCLEFYISQELDSIAKLNLAMTEK